MTDVFISYSRQNQKQVEVLAGVLEAQGYRVWWDRQLKSGSEYSREIELALNASKAVVVCWSTQANKSRWVKDEANTAVDANKLISITLDGELPPLGFRQFHTLDFNGWKGDQAAPEFGTLLTSLDDLQQHNTRSSSSSSGSGEPIKNNKRVGLTLAAIAVVVAAIGYAALNSQTRNGDDIETTAPTLSTDAPVEQAETKSIAVLPFEALSDDKSDIYFGKGVAEELLNALARVPDLKVAARTSAFSFEGTNTDISNIAQQLGVAHVLRGSVRRSGDRLRVTTQLVRVSDGVQLMSEVYEKQLSDIFDIQDEIVSELSRVLQFQLGVGVGAGRAAAGDVDSRAYDQYMRGLELWWRRHNDDHRSAAIIAFRNATELDPTFADAWAAYANSLALSGAAQIPGVKESEYKPHLQSALDKALSLNPENAKAHAAATKYYATKAIDVDLARKHLDSALMFAPNSALSHYTASIYHAVVGDLDAALAASSRVQALDPINQTMKRTRADLLAMMGRFSEVIPLLGDTARCKPTSCTFNHFLVTYGVVLGAHLQLEPDTLETELNQWRIAYESQKRLPKIAIDYSDFVFAYFDQHLGGEVDNNYWLTVDDSGWLFKQNAVIVASIFSQLGLHDRAIAALTEAYNNGNLFNSLQGVFAFNEGGWELTESTRQQPEYRAFWSLPGMARLAELRKANGHSAGLPL